MAIVVTRNGARLKALVTITAGTPIIIEAGNGVDPVKVDRLLIQMLHGGTGRGMVYDDVAPGTAPANIAATSGPPVELAAAGSDGVSPGGAYEDNPAQDPYNFIDLRNIAVDGTNSGDTVLVNARLKI